MAIASTGIRTSSTTGTAASAELIASSTNAYKLMEMGMALTAATAGSYSLGKPAAIGVTPTTPAALVFEDGGNTSTPGSTSALAWGTSPTAPTVRARRATLPAVIGAGLCWTFPRGFAVLKALSLVLFNDATPSVHDEWWVIDE